MSCFSRLQASSTSATSSSPRCSWSLSPFASYSLGWPHSFLPLNALLPTQFAVFFATAQAYILGVTRAKIALAVLHQNPSYWIVGHALSWLVYTASALLAWVATTRESVTFMIVGLLGQLAYLGWSIRVIVDFAHTLWPWFTAHEATMIVMYRQSFMPHRTVGTA